MKVLITGGAGFIGSHLCEALLKQDYEVVCLDNFNRFYDHSIKRDNISAFQKNEKFKLLEADLLDLARLKSFCSAEKVDVVVHLAAHSGSRRSVSDPFSFEENNIRGTLNLLQSCLECKISKFVFGSSYAVYGIGLPLPFKETQSPLKVISPFAVTKLTGEFFCHVYHYLYGIDFSILRYFSVYGPRQRPGTFLHELAKGALTGQPVKKIADGSIARDFIYIDDVVDATIKAIEKCKGLEIYNIGSGSSVKIDDVLQIVEEILKKKVLIDEVDVQTGIMPAAEADITKARLKLNWKPSVDLKSGISEFLKWLQQKELVEKENKSSLPPRRTPFPGQEEDLSME